MSQNSVDFSTDPTGAQLLDTLLTNFQENFHTCNIGTSTPSYAEIGTLWLDNTSSPWQLKIYNGTNNIVIGYVDNINLNFYPSKIADSSITTTKINALAVTAAKIAADAVTTVKILDANVTTAKIADNAVTLDKLNGGTADRLLGFDGSGNPSEYSVGTGLSLSGSVLNLNTTSPYTVIDRDVITSATTVDYSSIFETGKNYIFLFDNITWSSSDAAPFFKIENGGSFLSSSIYFQELLKVQSGATPTYLYNTGLSQGTISQNLDSGVFGSLRLIAPYDTDNCKVYVECYGYRLSGGTYIYTKGEFTLNTAAPFTGLQFGIGGRTMNGGTITVIEEDLS